jgi:tetratricopeptide (TPR) repeat protein
VINYCAFPCCLFSKKYDDLVNKGFSLLKSQDFSSALGYYQKALLLDSSKVEAIYGLGVVYCKDCWTSNKNCGLSLHYLNKAIKINPQYKKPLYYKGVLENQMRNYAEALKDLNKFMILYPRDTLALITRGVSKHFLGDKNGSCTDFYNAKSEGCYSAIRVIIMYCN